MRDRIINSLAATLTTLFFGALGFLVGCVVALLFDGALLLAESEITFSLIKSGCIGSAIFVFSAIAGLATQK